MKEELKTLKDIETPAYLSRREKPSMMVNPNDLRQEAIKWIKEDLEFAEDLRVRKAVNFVINGWKDRLNIKEEDLK